MDHDHGAGAGRRTLNVRVAVIGGGIAGLTAAAALGVGGVRTALIDRLPPDADVGATDGRTTAVLDRPLAILKGLGVWDRVAAETGVLRRMRLVNERAGFLGGEEVTFDAEEAGEEAFGRNIPNGALRRALVARLAELPTVEHLAPANADAVRFEADAARVTLDDGRRVTARLVVAADGRASPTRTAAGVRALSWSYGQTALVAALEHERPHDDTSTEFHRPGGPFTLVPLPGRRSSVVWVEKDADAAVFEAMDDAAFEAALKARTRGRLGDVRLAGPRHAYPLGACLATRFFARRLLIIAEAAHGLHPIGAQGLNLSLRDAATAAELVVDAERAGRDVAGRRLLLAYEARRRPDVLAKLAATDALGRAVGNDLGPLRLLRGLGLRALDRLGPVRSTLMRRGMDALGGEPRLALGRPL